MILIDGRKVSDSLKEKIKQEIISLKNRYNKVPGLVVILVGDNPASKAYVASKSKTCVELGMHSEKVELPENTSEEELLSLISKYNDDENIDGILVQLPLPKHIDETKVIDAINPAKDVDGFHPINVGNLVLGRECFVPCTPAGIIELLKYYNIETSGKHAVVIGRSSIVGKPMANLLMQKKCICELHRDSMSFCGKGNICLYKRSRYFNCGNRFRKFRQVAYGKRRRCRN